MFFIGHIFPYIAVVIFIGGAVGKLRRWLAVPSPFPLTVFPAPRSSAGRLLVLLREMLLFNSLFRHNRVLWLLSWTFHISLGLIVAGHIMGIYTFREQFTLLGLSKLESRILSHFLGMVTGIAYMITLIGLMGRRFYDVEARTTSDLANYVELGLLAGIGLTGMGLRWAMTGPEFALIRGYMAGLILFRPAAMPGSAWFFWHFALVNILVMYLPFSRLMHGLGGGITRMMLAEPPPEYPTPAGKPPRSALAGPTRHSRFNPPGSNMSVR